MEVMFGLLGMIKRLFGKTPAYTYVSDKCDDFKHMTNSQKVAFLAPYVICTVVVARISELYRLAYGDLEVFFKNINYLYSTHFYMSLKDVLYGLIVAIPLITYNRYHRKVHSKNEKFGVEHGSARWGTEKDIRPYIDPDPSYNIILSQTERLSMAPRMPQFVLNRNKHVMVIGGSGSGKTYGVVKLNLLQMHGSYVVTDPKGTVCLEIGNAFRVAGYKIKVLDLLDMEHSMHYNFFEYIETPKDILTLAQLLYNGLKPPNSGTPPDPFFDQAAILWLQAIIALIWYEAPKNEQNITTLLMFLDEDKVKEDDENYENGVDLLFKDLKKKNPFHLAVRQRNKYKMAAGKTAKSILISVASYFSKFEIPEVRSLLNYDELQLDTFGDPNQKTVLFVISDDTDNSYDFISSILFTQMFNVLCHKAYKVYGGKLPTHVQFIIDEFANIPEIPRFKQLIATVRSRGISIIMMLQTKSQLKDTYKEGAETIIGNCDSEIFLGGKESTTLKDLQDALGQETIDLFTESETFSNQKSNGVNYSKVGRNLMSINELNVMPMDHCIVQIRGLPPFYSYKYVCNEHPNFKYTGDKDPKYMFDFWKYWHYMKHKEALEKEQQTKLQKKKKEKQKAENMHGKEGVIQGFDTNLKFKKNDRFIAV